MSGTPDFLARILFQKRLRLASAKEQHAVESLRAEAFDARQSAPPHHLRAALKDSTKFNLIAEIKRASPSKGLIRADVDPAKMALKYEAGGAAAISVLTEEDYFQGSLNDLREVRAATRLPVLRKDFIFDEYQVYEAASAGADALLLIVAALDDERLMRLLRITEDELAMDALVEVHTVEELQSARACKATLIGVNNRDLHSFNVSLDVSKELIRGASPDLVFVSESGLRTNDDLRRLRALGYLGFLMGETLMRADAPEEVLRGLLTEES